MSKPQDYKTIARLVAEFQRPYHEIKAAFDAAGAIPEYLHKWRGVLLGACCEHMAERLPERNTIQARRKAMMPPAHPAYPIRGIGSPGRPFGR